MTGALAHSAAHVIRKLLVDLGCASEPGADDDWPAYAHREPDTPDSVITVTNGEGIREGRHQNNGEVQQRYGFQIRIRGVSPEAAWVKANAIAIALDEEVKLDVVTVSDVIGTGSGAYTVYGITRSPVLDLGRESPETDRSVLTLNGTVSLKQN